jgi:hypothetical protein
MVYALGNDAYDSEALEIIKKLTCNCFFKELSGMVRYQKLDVFKKIVYNNDIIVFGNL